MKLDDIHVGTLRDAGKERLDDIINKTTELFTNTIIDDLEQQSSTISRLEEGMV